MLTQTIMSDLTLEQAHQCFDGTVGIYQHHSRSCNGPMKFAVYQPPQIKTQAVPVLYFLSGLTCNEQNFITKAGAQYYAAKAGICLVVPDTSPRNTGIPTENDDWVYGSGAGFYVDATEPPWNQHYQMYQYIVEELPSLIAANFSIHSDRQGIFGHSMGGHGALVMGLRNRDRYRSISAFAPICHPSQSDWAKQAFGLYLGHDLAAWQQYDACELVRQCVDERPILVDQGLADPYLSELMPDSLEQACQDAGRSLTLRRHVGYDHSYYFISSFIADHIQFHSKILAD